MTTLSTRTTHNKKIKDDDGEAIVVMERADKLLFKDYDQEITEELKWEDEPDTIGPDPTPNNPTRTEASKLIYPQFFNTFGVTVNNIIAKMRPFTYVQDQSWDDSTADGFQAFLREYLTGQDDNPNWKFTVKRVHSTLDKNFPYGSPSFYLDVAVIDKFSAISPNNGQEYIITLDNTDYYNLPNVTDPSDPPSDVIWRFDPFQRVVDLAFLPKEITLNLSIDVIIGDFGGINSGPPNNFQHCSIGFNGELSACNDGMFQVFDIQMATNAYALAVYYKTNNINGKDVVVTGFPVEIRGDITGAPHWDTERKEISPTNFTQTRNIIDGKTLKIDYLGLPVTVLVDGNPGSGPNNSYSPGGQWRGKCFTSLPADTPGNAGVLWIGFVPRYGQRIFLTSNTLDWSKALIKITLYDTDYFYDPVKVVNDQGSCLFKLRTP